MAHGPALTLAIRDMGFAGGRPLFQDFNLSVAPAEVVALIGPSGVGKTTLLRILAGVELGFSGTALVDGTAADKAPLPGLVFQDARLLPWLTAAENLRAVRPTLADEEIDAALARVGLAGLAQAWPRQLSGGMQRRLGLARALSVNPGLLLLDEPFVSLDRAVVRELQSLVCQLIAQARPTAVLVSHDPEDAAHLAHRAILLSGRPARVLADLTLPGIPGSRSRADIATLTDLIETTASKVAA